MQYLKQIMRGDVRLDRMGKRLVDMVNEVYNSNQEEDLEPVNYNTLVLKSSHTPSKERWSLVTLKIKEHYIYRGEILLKDISDQYGIEMDFTVEDVIVALYCDFIKEVRKGHTKELIDNILASYEYYGI